MALYVMATRLAGGTLTSPESLERVEREVMNRVREHKLDVLRRALESWPDSAGCRNTASPYAGTRTS